MEDKGEVNSERDHILRMLWLCLKGLKEDMGLEDVLYYTYTIQFWKVDLTWL